MPRSKRRPGVVKGKTERQLVHAAQNRAKRDRERRRAAQAKMAAEARDAAQAEVFDKYANYPGNR